MISKHIKLQKLIPDYKKYISTLLHNPNLLKKYFLNLIEVEENSIQHRALVLLTWSEYLTRNTRVSSVWTSCVFVEGMYPHFLLLYAFITGKALPELQEFEKQEMLDHYPEEIIFLQDIYQNIPPDEKMLREVPMLVDLFGFIDEVKFEIPTYFFDQIGQFGAYIKCKECKVVTHVRAYNIVQIQAEPTDLAYHQYQHQCQTCGSLKFADLHNVDESLVLVSCDCGGHFRRDKPIICSNCKQAEIKKAETFVEF